MPRAARVAEAVNRTHATARCAVRIAAKVADRVRPPVPGITALIYHRVGGRTPSSVDLPTDQFADQMAYLAERCSVVTIDDAVDRLAGCGPPEDGRPVVVVTFDDGTADFVEEALPVLERYGIPATYYLATDHIEGQRRFPYGGAPMSWRDAADAVSTGLVTIGSHTHTHAVLDRAAPAEAAQELDRSIELIEDRLGVPARHFAYPKALLGPPEVETEVRSRFRSASVARSRRNPYGGSNPYRLTRTPVQKSDTAADFAHKVDGGFALESDVRDLVNRWRYRNLVS